MRIGSRAGQPPFDWEDEATCAPAPRGVGAVYLTYYPDLAMPGAVDTVRAFVAAPVERGVRRLVFLFDRGEEEAQRAEQAVMGSGINWTILRSSWFAQNFSEDYLLDDVLGGEVVLPAGNVGEPFVDADDIANAAVAALTEEGHASQLYELIGPPPTDLRGGRGDDRQGRRPGDPTTCRSRRSRRRRCSRSRVSRPGWCGCSITSSRRSWTAATPI